MKNLLSVLVVLLIGINSSSILGNNIIQGKVISEDGDPIAGVQVTDGYNFVQTKADGTYALEIFPEAAFVYITTPPGYEAPEKKGVVKFYYPLNASDQNKRTYDFVLKKIEDDYEHTFIALADVQVFRDEEFPMLNEAVKDIQKHIDSYSLKEPLHLMDLGDLVFDRMDFFPEYIASLEKTGKPVFRVVGNHDINLNNRSNAETTRSYKKYFGPDYYAFNRGEIHYVVLNDVFYLGREYFYMGYLTEQQLSWLEKDLEYVEPGSTVVVAVHIPTTRRNEKEEGFRYDRISSSLVNNNALWKILSDYNVHLLSGHTHTSSRFRIADNIVEHNIAAVSGSWWQSDICPDGAPSGYMVFHATGDKLTHYYKSIGAERDKQFRVYLPEGELSEDDALVVNVWDWDEEWSVIWKQDGKEMGEMQQFSGIDPLIKDILSDRDKLIHSWTNPVETHHLFKAFPDNDAKHIEIIVTDAFGRKYKKNISLVESEK